MDKKKEIDMTLVNLTRHKIKQEEQKKGKHLTKRQRKNIMFYTSIGLFIFSGVLGGKATLALNEAKENAKTEVTVDAINKDEINMNNVDFKSGLSVNIDGYKVEPNEIKINEDIKKSVNELVDSVENPIDVLNIAKKVYVEKYNESHEGENIDINSIKLHSTKSNLWLYEEKAKNGDDIYRVSTGGSKGKSGQEILSVELYDRDINDDDAKKLNCEYATRYGAGFVTAYSENDEVEKYEDNILAKMGDVMYTAIHYSSFLESNGFMGGKVNLREQYENSFKKALEEYKQNEIEQESKQYVADDWEMEQ